jgi:hypothetical protein
MLTASKLSKFIFDKNPQLHPARLSLYNFVKHLAYLELDLTLDQLNHFLAWTMDFPYWQQNKTQIGNELRQVLTAYSKQHHEYIDVREIEYPESKQVFEILNPDDGVDIVQHFARGRNGADSRHHILLDQNKRLILVSFVEGGHIEVMTLNRQFVIREGRLEPLRRGLILQFDARGQLREGVLQTLELSPYVTAQFAVRQGVYFGSILRGYMFQRMSEFAGAELESLLPVKTEIQNYRQLIFTEATPVNSVATLAAL